MANILYNKLLYHVCGNSIDFSGHTFKIALIADTYTPDATDEDWDAGGVGPASEELPTAGGYTANGITLSDTLSTSSGTTKWDAVDVSWTSATFTARYAVVYDDSTTPLKYLVCMFDFGANKSVTAGTFTLTFHANGLISLAQA